MPWPLTDFLPVVSADDEANVRAFLHESETAPPERRSAASTSALRTGLTVAIPSAIVAPGVNGT